MFFFTNPSPKQKYACTQTYDYRSVRDIVLKGNLYAVEETAILSCDFLTFRHVRADGNLKTTFIMANLKPLAVSGESSRFQLLSDDDILGMMDVATSNNRKKQIKFSIGIFEEHLQAVNPTLEEAEQLPNSELDSLLSRFYSSVRTNKREYYSKNSMQAIRFGLQSHFVSTKLVDIIPHECQFCELQENLLVHDGHDQKGRKRLSQTQGANNAEDMATIQQSFDLNKPADLEDKVFMDVMIYFCNRGKENLWQMTPDQFEITREP